MKLPNLFNADGLRKIADDLTAGTLGRALPNSRGGETPKQLQTYRTQISGYLTQPSNETQLLYSAENWVKIKLTLKTAGPVAIGTSAALAPVLSGMGIILTTDELFEAYLAKGTRMYVTSQTVNRISMIVEPVPWLEQLDGDMQAQSSATRKLIAMVGTKIVEAVDAIRTGVKNATRDPDGNAAPAPTFPRLPPAVGVPRLTGITMPSKMPRR